MAVQPYVFIRFAELVSRGASGALGLNCPDFTMRETYPINPRLFLFGIRLVETLRFAIARGRR